MSLPNEGLSIIFGIIIISTMCALAIHFEFLSSNNKISKPFSILSLISFSNFDI